MDPPVDLTSRRQTRPGTPPISPETKANILADLASGKSQHQTAKDHNVSTFSVSTLAAKHGIPAAGANVIRTKMAIAARVHYDAERRANLVDRAFEIVSDLLERSINARDIQAAVTSLAILIDKRRLESGEVTARTETLDSAVAAKLAAKLDALAAQQRPVLPVRDVTDEATERPKAPASLPVDDSSTGHG